MKTLINVRGPSGSGKTEAMRQFIGMHDAGVQEIQLSVCRVKITELRDIRCAVLGSYDGAKCGGADRYKNGKSDIAEAMAWASLNLSPEVILYEHMISSHSTKATYEIAAGAMALGYEYFGILFIPPLETCKERILARSGKDGSFKRLETLRKGSITAASALAKSGMRIMAIDTGKIPLENMGAIIERAVMARL